MFKKNLTSFLLIMSGLLAEKSPTRLTFVNEEMDKTETSMDETMQIKAAQLFQQEVAPVLLNANFARLFFAEKLRADSRTKKPSEKNAFDTIDLSHWRLYILNLNHPELNQFVLSVPITYAEKLKEPLLGFNQAELKHYNSDASGIGALIKDLSYDQPIETAKLAAALKNLFDTTANTRWTIFMAGHGRECLLAPEKTPVTSILKSSAERPFGRIADIPTAEFLKFVTFLEKDLDVSLLLLETCYASGYHAQAINQTFMLSHNKTMAVALCGSSSDKVVLGGHTAIFNSKRADRKEDRTYKDFFTKNESTGVETPKDIASSIGYVCSGVTASIRAAGALEFAPFEIYPEFKPIESESTEDLIVTGILNVTKNEFAKRVFIEEGGGKLEFKTADTSKFLFSKIILSSQNSIDYALNELIGFNCFLESTGEFRRLRDGSAHPMVIRVEVLNGKKEQTQLKDELVIAKTPNGFIMNSVVAIRYPSQLLYDGNLIFATQSSSDNKYTIYQLLVGDNLLPRCIKQSKPQVLSSIELKHKINDTYIQSMVNEYLQELAAFGLVDKIKLFLKAIKEPANLEISRKVLALLEKKNLLPYTLPNQQGIQLAFATAIAQGELNTARELFTAIKSESKCFKLLINGLIALYPSIPKSRLRKSDIYEDSLAFLNEIKSKLPTT